MSLSKCSPWFGCHSVVKIPATWFEFDDISNPGSKTPSWTQLSHGVSFFVMVVCYFQGKNWFCVKKRWKRLFLKLHCPTSETNSPIIYDVIVGCQCVLKCWGHQPYNDIYNIYTIICLVVFFWKSNFWPHGYFSHKKRILMFFFLT